MRLLYIYQALAVWGGIERVLIDKMNYLANIDNIEVFMLTTSQGKHSIPFDINKAIHIKDLDIRFHTKYKKPLFLRPFETYRLQHLFEKRLKEIICSIKPDIIISTTSLYVDTINKLRGNIPYIVESHSIKKYTAINPNPRIKWLYNYYRNKYLNSISKATTLVTLTNGDAEEWSNIKKESVVIPNIVHLNPTASRSTTENKKVIFVGRFALLKGIDKLINIWEIVHKKHPDWILEMYGEGELKNYYINQINNYNDKLNIHIFSPTNNIYEKYKQCSIFILTSISESFGLVIAEAMSCGLPVVSFNCPYGPKDIITNNEDGFLIEQNNIFDFASKINFLIENDSIRKEMGYKAYLNSLRFSPNAIMPKWIKLFNDVINHN